MSSDELIEVGFCDDLIEVFDQFPLEYLTDYGGDELRICGPTSLLAVARIEPYHGRCGRSERVAADERGGSPRTRKRKRPWRNW